MIKGIKVLCVCSVLLNVIPLYSWVPTFGKGDTLNVGGKIVGIDDSITYPSPKFADWDYDGKIDLLIGYWGIYRTPSGLHGYGGRIKLFKNIGTNKDPAYERKKDLHSSSGVIELTAN